MGRIAQLPTIGLFLVLAWAGEAPAAQPIDAGSATRWTPCLGWVTNPPVRYELTAAPDGLRFAATGVGAELPWNLVLRDEESDGEARYLVIRYRAEGVLETPGNYLLHGKEGSPTGRTYIPSERVRSDGNWHELAVDLLALEPVGATSQLAIKVRVGPGGHATLTVAQIRFADAPPPGAEVVTPPAPTAREVVLAWADTTMPEARAGWITHPAEEHQVELGPEGLRLRVFGAGRGMRWTMALPEPVDLARLPYLSFRYRARGELGLGGYTIWLGDRASGSGGQACIAVAPSGLVADGRPRRFTVRLGQSFTATQIALGLDAAGDAAELELGPVTFGSAPPRIAIGEALPHGLREAPWPAGRNGYTVVHSTVEGGRPSPFLGQRLGLADWFGGPEIVVAGRPFRVPVAADQVVQTGTVEQGSLRLLLPPEAKEVYLLTACTAPATEPFGIEPNRPRIQERLTVPEKVTVEVRYRTGPPDVLLPIDLEEGTAAIRRGLGVAVVHPDPERSPTELWLHDHMQTAAFAILGATWCADALVPEPAVAEPSYPPPPSGAVARLARVESNADPNVVASGALAARFDTSAGLTLRGLAPFGEAPPGAAGAPIFEVEIDDRTVPAEVWQVVAGEPSEDGRTWTLVDAADRLRARVECRPGAAHELVWNMTLTNEGEQLQVITLRFPLLRGIRIGSAEDTWYLYGRRGGIIHHAPATYRDPLGERHPLQVDGFFNPQLGPALACLTHDTVGRHHFRRLAKGSDGGEWSPEYVRRDLAPGATFVATEASTSLVDGDWRAIFNAYRRWLVSWYEPPARKPWWEETFAFLGCNASYEMSDDPQVRGAIQPRIERCVEAVGACDYVHLFGWAASRTYGDWGDYAHYDETVGGREAFAANIARAREAGVAVGLYQDAYLSSANGEAVGAYAEEWAMRRPDGSPNYVPEYRAYNQCPYLEPWQEYLAATLRRIHQDLQPAGLYIDEYGATDGRWICHGREHGHSAGEIPYPAEVAMLRRIREAVGDEVALYTEYPPAEASRRYLDGSFTYQVVWSVDEEPRAAHFVDLPRFAFPRYKQFHLIHYVRPYAGNWWPYKFPFFNGESLVLSEPALPGYDPAALAFCRKAIAVQRAHRAAFASDRCEPLVPTEVPGVFANAFFGEDETVWTLYNSTNRTVRGTVLTVEHPAGARYHDAWSDRPLTPPIAQGVARIELELGPKAVGCVAQTRRQRPRGDSPEGRGRPSRSRSRR